jgi:aspartate/methionine/tyrosine aminotransferase
MRISVGFSGTGLPAWNLVNRITNRVSARVAAIGESPTLAVDAKAKALQAAGEDVIGFGAGEPDFPTPDHIVEAAIAAAKDPAMHRYTPAAGLPALRAGIASKTKRDSGYEVAPEQVLVTNGGKHAVFAAMAVISDPGDEIICPAPFWVTYPEAITLAGAVPKVIETTVETAFRVTVDQLEAARTERTKAVLFVSPNNPTGAVYPKEEIEAIGWWALRHGIWVITDEIYEHLTFGPHTFHSMPVLVPDIADQCIVLNGVAKTYAMTGWRVGWMIGPRDIVKAATNLQSHSTSNVCNVAQAAALAAVTGDLEAVKVMRAAFERRGRTMQAMLSDIPGVTCLEPQGAFYCFPSFEKLLNHPVGDDGRVCRDTLELADVILTEANVALVPGEAFGAPGYARLTFALADAALEEGVGRLQRLFS